jgi:NodT family efflux transporter outer membrane factor (OMF) lipoprotein
MRVLCMLMMAAALLAGCAAPKSAVPTAIVVEGSWSAKPVAVATASTVAASTPWWRAWNDAQLDALIAQALRDNPEAAVLAARVAQARASQAATRASAMPSVTLGAGAQREGVSRRLRVPAENGAPGRAERSQFNLDGPLSYELDWLGRSRLAETAAGAQAQAAGHDAAVARLVLVAEVVDAYADMALAQHAAGLAEQRKTVSTDTLSAEQRLLAAGLATQRAVREREDAQASAVQSAEEATRQHKQAADRLALLLGQPAHRYAAPKVSDAMLEQPLSLGADQPVDVIGRRPDVQAAWQRLLAATAEGERAALERYPHLGLNGSTGLLAETLGHWLRRDALGWMLGLHASVPLFDGGRIQAQTDQARTAAQERQAEYRRAVLTALQEVESALAQWQYTARSLEQAALALQRREEGERQVRATMAAGRTGRISVNEALSASLEARAGLARARHAHVQSHVLLRRALAEPVGADMPTARGG